MADFESFYAERLVNFDKDTLIKSYKDKSTGAKYVVEANLFFSPILSDPEFFRKVLELVKVVPFTNRFSAAYEEKTKTWAKQFPNSASTKKIETGKSLICEFMKRRVTELGKNASDTFTISGGAFIQAFDMNIQDLNASNFAWIPAAQSYHYCRAFYMSLKFDMALEYAIRRNGHSFITYAYMIRELNKLGIDLDSLKTEQNGKVYNGAALGKAVWAALTKGKDVQVGKRRELKEKDENNNNNKEEEEEEEEITLTKKERKKLQKDVEEDLGPAPAKPKDVMMESTAGLKGIALAEAQRKNKALKESHELLLKKYEADLKAYNESAKTLYEQKAANLIYLKKASDPIPDSEYKDPKMLPSPEMYGLDIKDMPAFKEIFEGSTTKQYNEVLTMDPKIKTTICDSVRASFAVDYLRVLQAKDIRTGEVKSSFACAEIKAKLIVPMVEVGPIPGIESRIDLKNEDEEWFKAYMAHMANFRKICALARRLYNNHLGGLMGGQQAKKDYSSYKA